MRLFLGKGSKKSGNSTWGGGTGVSRATKVFWKKKNLFKNHLKTLFCLTEKIYEKPKNESLKPKLALTWNLRSKFARLLKQDNNESYTVEHSWHLVCWDLKNRENFKQFFTFEETFFEQLLLSHQTKKWQISKIL